MKKILVLALVTLFASLAFTQGQSKRVLVLEYGTLASVIPETRNVWFGDWAKIDSISLTAVATGELDVDSVDVYLAYQGDDGIWVDVSVLATATVTLNLAAAVEDIERLFTSDVGILSGANLRGANAASFIVQPAAGCDATDPNDFKLVLQIWGTR